jgi:hypothetical protein
MWEVLSGLIKNHVEAQIADSWKGGGDPADYELCEVAAKYAELQLQRHIEEIRKEFEDYAP